MIDFSDDPGDYEFDFFHFASVQTFGKSPTLSKPSQAKVKDRLNGSFMDLNKQAASELDLEVGKGDEEFYWKKGLMTFKFNRKEDLMTVSEFRLTDEDRETDKESSLGAL